MASSPLKLIAEPLVVAPVYAVADEFLYTMVAPLFNIPDKGCILAVVPPLA